MAIFSTSKKSKRDGSNNNVHGSPNLGSSTSSSVNHGGGLPRSASGSFSVGPRYDTNRAASPRDYASPYDATASSSHQLLSSSVSSSSSAPAPPLAVLYPWSQRPLHLLPAVTLVNEPSSDADVSLAAQTKLGDLSLPPFPRYGHSVNPVAAVNTGELYIFGGLVQNEVKNDLYVLHCSTKVSSTSQQQQQQPLSIGLVETTGEVPGPRVGHASVGVGNVLIVWGGDTKSRPEDRQDDGLYLLNLSTKEWTRVKVAGPAPEGRYGHAAAMVGSRFFIFGGQKDDGGFLNDLVWFDLQKLKTGSPRWTFVNYPAGAVAPPRRTGHTSVTHGDCIYIFGGTDGQYHYNDTWCYDTNAGTWVELSCIGYIPVPREGHSATLVDDVMYVFGGRGVDGKDLEDLAAFKISSKIKYPSDTSRQSQAAQRKSSMPTMTGTGQTDRTISPTPDERSSPSNGGAIGSSDAAKFGKRGGDYALSSATAPQRPTRPDDDVISRRTPDSGAVRDADRVVSPGPSRPRASSQGASQGSLRSLRPVSPPALNQQHTLMTPLDSSTMAKGGVDVANPPADAFYYGSRAPDGLHESLRTRDAEVAELRAQQSWMLSALSSAASQGFVIPPKPEHSSSLPKLDETVMNGATNATALALLQLKQELASAKSHLADQALTLDEHLAESTRATAVALQEAAYYQARLAAIERGSVDDLESLGQDRLRSLERQVTEAEGQRHQVQTQLAQLEKQLETIVGERALIEERHQAASHRADAAESSYSRALADYAELQKRAHGHEATLQYHSERITSLSLDNKQLEAENARLQASLEEARAATDQHSRALTDAQAALIASAAQHDDLRSVHDRLVETSRDHETQNATLQSELSSARQEAASLRERLEATEQQLKASHEAHSTARALATGGLAELLASRTAKSKTVDTHDDRSANITNSKGTEEMHAALQQSNDDLKAQYSAAITKLDECNAKNAQLQSQVVQLRGELGAVRAQLTQAQLDNGHLQSALQDKDDQLNRHRSQLIQADTRVQLLRNFMAEHNIIAADDDLERKYPPLSGDESAEELHRKVQELQSRLEQQRGLQAELKATHLATEQERDEHRAQLEKLKSDAASNDQATRVKLVETELEALKSRHTQLEGTHLKAVQYVKGTEKMLRRMKEELTRYKDRCDELEAKSSSIPDEHVSEMAALRSRVAELETTRLQKEELQRKLSGLQTEHERARSASNSKAEELSKEVSRLDHELDKARHDLEETLSINASLNQELTAALKNSSPNRSTDDANLTRLEGELAQAQNRAEWLRRENAALEERCRTAESKISVLLDHLEGGSDEQESPRS
ncbi:hypothetical protein OIO90_000984 [Microbotryomycetes sp. JL221]|nr:hypothetical protein OIO90_000984 [Microbotryomycetes sp. JL221]